MATDPNKENETFEQEQREAGKVKVTSADGTATMWMTPEQAAAYQAKHKTSASKTQETAPAAPELNLEEKYKEAGKLLDESNTEAVNAITNSYGLQETAMGKILEEAETLRAEKQKFDEKAQKRANTYRYITGIGDAISGIANLVGTAHGAANQEQHYNAPAVIQKAEASRKERKLEMEQLNERLRELKAQKGALAATKEMKLGEQRAKHAAEKAALELQKAEDELGLAKTAISAASRENVANIRGQYQVETQEEKNKGTGTSSGTKSPKDVHPFDFGNGKGVNIPDHLWTDTAIESVYQLIPIEEQTRRVRKNQFGLDEKDANGNPVYYATTDDKIADIVRAAKTNPEVQEKLKAIARGSIFGRL